ncbi:MAG: enoyl-[acyl-carrier protein] reductase I [Planctomycetota bacterium]|jgi:enoyl-[acyl-carrier protein] reductase I
MDGFGMQGRRVLVVGLANRKSVAYHVGKKLEEAGAIPIYVVHTEERKLDVQRLTKERDVHVCDLRQADQIEALASAFDGQPALAGIVHSVAFANYSRGPVPFHETERKDFLDAIDVSCFSLVALSNAFRERLTEDASVVTISISSTTMASENYGYMAPVKAALDSAVVFLAKSFSKAGRVRFNGVRAGLLKTSSSAGIPGYLDSYMFAEKATLRDQGLRTEEVADTTLFLLSPRSSGINAQGLVVDAGMSVNYFDKEIVRSFTEAQLERDSQ